MSCTAVPPEQSKELETQIHTDARRCTLIERVAPKFFSSDFDAGLAEVDRRTRQRRRKMVLSIF